MAGLPCALAVLAVLLRITWRSVAAIVIRVVAEAARSGVALDELAAYGQPSTTQAGFVFGFGAIDEDRIDPGLAMFAAALRACRARPVRS